MDENNNSESTRKHVMEYIQDKLWLLHEADECYEDRDSDVRFKDLNWRAYEDTKDDDLIEIGEDHFNDLLAIVLHIPNPLIPLKSDRFPGDVYVENKENRSEMKKEHYDSAIREKLLTKIDFSEKVGPPPLSELALFADDEEEEWLVYDEDIPRSATKAHVMALKAYLDKSPAETARAALKIHEVPEAYNVIAASEDLHASAFRYYDKAMRVTAKLVPNLKKLCKEGRAWDTYPLRSYVRATHGKAVCLRKLGELEEAEYYYKKLLKMNPDYPTASASYVNWRYGFLEVFLAQGKIPEAHNWACSRQMRTCYSLASSRGAFYWTLALLEFSQKTVVRFDDRVYKYKQEGKIKEPQREGAVHRAFKCAPKVLEILTKKSQLPHCGVPLYFGSSKSLSNAAVYCLTYMRYWRETQGAIDWATYNVNTYKFINKLQELHEKGEFKTLRKKTNDEELPTLLRDGIYLDAHMPATSQKVINVMGKWHPALIKSLVQMKARGDVRELDYDQFLSLHEAVENDWHPLCIKHLILLGSHDPYSSPTSGTGSSKTSHEYGEPGDDLKNTAVGVAVNAGIARTVHAILSHAPPSVKSFNLLLRMLFHSAMYECSAGSGKKCERCKPFLLYYKHSAHTNFEACITVLLATQLTPTRKTLKLIRKFTPESKLPLLQSLSEQLGLTRKQLQGRLDTVLGYLFPVCSLCHSAGSLRKCQQCTSVYYCSKNCQRRDWKEHRIACEMQALNISSK